jgi:hypothetical protein
MQERAASWFRQALIGLVLGLALGFAVGWWLWPVTYTNTSPAALRQDYRDDYVLMVAAAYDVEGNLQKARSRLKRLNPEEPAAPAQELAEKLIERGGQETDIVRLARLVQALGVTDPLLTPYLEGQS